MPLGPIGFSVFYLGFLYIEVVALQNVSLLVLDLLQRCQAIEANKSVAFGAAGTLVEDHVGGDDASELLKVATELLMAHRPRQIAHENAVH